MPTVIWDWNGTLLNDLDLCIQTINSLLHRRDLPLINGDHYREVFSFPVKDYYKAIGFDFSKEDFAIPAKEFIDNYDREVFGCPLQPGAIEILEAFDKAGIRQYVLSAMRQEMLDKTLSHYKLTPFFQGIFGLDDHYAHSKVYKGKQLLTSLSTEEREDTWIVGDTIHDFEVAQELNTSCILIADGHQSKDRLIQTGARVVSNLKDLPELLLS